VLRLGNRSMSVIGNSIPPRDPSGRFTRRTNAPLPLLPAESPEQLESEAAPLPYLTQPHARPNDLRPTLPSPSLLWFRNSAHLRRSPPPDVETEVVRFKESTREEEGHEIDDLMRRMRGLSVRDEAYALLYAKCAAWYPTVAQSLPKPQIVNHTHTTFSVQTSAPPPPPSRPSWPATVNPPPPPSSANPSSFFRPPARSDGCAFCSQPGHRMRTCPSAQEYVRTGRTIIQDDRLSLPNVKSPFPSCRAYPWLAKNA
jgi:hypothetical protein